MGARPVSAVAARGDSDASFNVAVGAAGSGVCGAPAPCAHKK